MSESEVKQIIYAGRTNTKSVVLGDGKKDLSWVLTFMFDQLDKDIKTEVEGLFWERIVKLANYR